MSDKQPTAQEIKDLEAELDALSFPGEANMVPYKGNEDASEEEPDEHGLTETDYQEIADEMDLSLDEVRKMYQNTKDAEKPIQQVPAKLDDSSIVRCLTIPSYTIKRLRNKMDRDGHCDGIFLKNAVSDAILLESVKLAGYGTIGYIA